MAESVDRASNGASPARHVKSAIFILLGGVVLPLFTLAFEAATHTSGEAFFDPIPSLPHIVLLALVPLSNTGLLYLLWRPELGLPKGWGVFNAFAIGLAAVYALLYLPLTPFAPFLVFFYGLGFLPLTPLLALLAAWRGRAVLKRRSGGAVAGLWRGIGLAVLALFLVNLPASLTRFGLDLAARSDQAEARFGVRWLRAVGDEKLLRQLCYSRSGLTTDLLGMLVSLGDAPSPETVRKIYYQVTGQPFNHLPEPVRKGLRASWRDGDLDLGGKQVGQRNEGVSLSQSRLDGSFDADAALGYLEWTLVFRNDSARQQEARAQIALPPGAVVSRLTLWIDGEEREAAFGSRRQTSEAYRQVVQARRDPVLVTTAGKDRVMLQLFPIPPGGGEMKVRLGITTPLQLDSTRVAQLFLPAWRERNFEIAPQLNHAVWLAANRPLSGADFWRREKTGEQAYALRGELSDAQLAGPGSRIELAREALAGPNWSQDAVAGGGRVVSQRFEESVATPPHRLALVVDGSQGLAGLAGEIAAALGQLPDGIELGLFPASDAPGLAVGPLHPAQAAERLRQMSFVGGQDNLPALGQAWDWAGEGGTAGGAVLWIHGPQPVLLGGLDGIRQRSERQPGRVRFYALEAQAGPNEILQGLDGMAGVSVLRRSGALRADLAETFATWQPGRMAIRALRSEQPSIQPGEAVGKTSDHLVRLWAAEQIDRLLARGDQASRQAAGAMAVKYHLVTPVSGAVVLETAAQYAAAGLEPVAPGSVPTVPEPEEWLLMAVVAALLGWLWRRRRAGLLGAGAPA